MFVLATTEPHKIPMTILSRCQRFDFKQLTIAELTEELILEGLAREFVRNVQALRKEKDFVITDHIKVYYNGTDKVEEMFRLYKDYIMGEVLGDELIKDISLKNKYELNDEEAYIDVERIK